MRLEFSDEFLLTHETPELSSYRNQSIYLLFKSIDWFLYDGDFGVQCVKQGFFLLFLLFSCVSSINLRIC